MSLSSFKVGTFNTYNLVLPGVTYYGNRKYSQTDYNRKVNWLAEQLKQMDADVIGFQEVFNKAALQEVASASGIYEGAEVLIGGGHNEDLGPLTALVTRYPVLEHGSITEFPDEARLEYGGGVVPIDTFTKPVLWARIKISDAVIITVIVVHLKSKRPIIPEDADGDDPKVKASGKAKALILRAAESYALRCIIVDMLRDTREPVILMGDVNDAVHAVTSNIIAGSPPWRYLPRDKKEDIWDVLLYNVKDIQALRSYHDVYYTHIFDGHYDSLDHIFVSEEFVFPNPDHIAYVENVAVLNDHLIDETSSSEDVPIWQSDHGQVIATLTTVN
jgi:predicted extracellular nuclease